MRRLLVIVLSVLLVSASAVGAAPEAEPPAGTTTVAVAGSELTLWPYTFQQPAAPGQPSDPINLVFPDSDPREIRQALMQYDGTRPFPPQLGRNCRWSDAMGNEQASWADDGWVGSEVQLVCIDPGPRSATRSASTCACSVTAP